MDQDVQPSADDAGVEALWEALWAGDVAVRERLINHYAPLVQIIARKVKGTLPKHVDVDDLYTCGVFGLIEAIDRYQADKNVRFENFAYFRIRGSMIDELRSLDWVPRSVRSRSKTLSGVREEFVAQHHRQPTDQELADALGVEVGRLHELESQAKEAEWVISLNEAPVEMANAGSEQVMNDLASDSQPIEDQLAEEELLAQVRARLSKVLDGLPDRQMLTLAFYYLYEMTLSEVGEVMGVSESRVCQIQTKALTDLRERLEPTLLEPA